VHLGPLFAAACAVVEILAPPALAVWVLATLRTGERSGLVGAGAWAPIIGAGLFVLAWSIEQAARAIGLPPERWLEGWHGQALAIAAISAATLPAVCEEVVRFASAVWLFRSPRTRMHPLILSAPFAIGWGALECIRAGVQTLHDVHVSAPGSVWLPELPVLQLIERFFALLLQLALSGAAAQAAQSRREGRALALFSTAVGVHLAIDAIARAIALPAARSLEAGDLVRALQRYALMELVFGVLAGAAFLTAMTRLRPSEATPPAA